MNKNHTYTTNKSKTVFSRKIDSRKREMGLLWSAYLLSAIRQTNKQMIYSFNYIQAPGLHKIQYYNIYMTVIIIIIIV